MNERFTCKLIKYDFSDDFSDDESISFLNH